MKKAAPFIFFIIVLHSPSFAVLEPIRQTLRTVGSTLYHISTIYYLNSPDYTHPTLEDADIVSIVPIITSLETRRNNTAEEIKTILWKKNLNDIIVIGNQQYRVTNGISQELGDTVTFYLGGFMNDCKPFPWYATRQIYKGLDKGSFVIARNHPTDDRRRFNPGGKQDIQFIKVVIDEICKKNNNTPIFIHAACIGWVRFLPFLSRCANDPDYALYADRIIGIIAESPPISINKTIDSMLSLNLPIAHHLASYWFPNLKGEKPHLGDHLPAIPLFIASVQEDTLVNLNDLNREIELWKAKMAKGKQKPYIEHFISGNKSLVHGRVTKDPEFWRRAIAFKNNILKNIDV